MPNYFYAFQDIELFSHQLQSNQIQSMAHIVEIHGLPGVRNVGHNVILCSRIKFIRISLLGGHHALVLFPAEYDRE